MKRYTQKDALFLGRSILWSLLLYCAAMAVINWEDVSGSMTGKNPVTIISRISPEPGTDADPAGTPAHISSMSPTADALAGALHTLLQLLPR